MVQHHHGLLMTSYNYYWGAGLGFPPGYPFGTQRVNQSAASTISTGNPQAAGQATPSSSSAQCQHGPQPNMTQPPQSDNQSMGDCL